MVTGVTEFQTKPGHTVVDNFGPVDADGDGFLSTAIDNLKNNANALFPNANYIVSFTQREEPTGHFHVEGDAAKLSPVP